MLQMRFGVLNDEDFNFAEENRENMLDQMAAKLNKSRSELATVFAELQKL